jgi:excisionase family DNA binding protein
MRRQAEAQADSALTIPETAVALNVSKQSVYRLIACGDLPATDVACSTSTRTKTRVLRSAVNDFLRTRTRTA